MSDEAQADWLETVRARARDLKIPMAVEITVSSPATETRARIVLDVDAFELNLFGEAHRRSRRSTPARLDTSISPCGRSSRGRPGPALSLLDSGTTRVQR